MGRESLQIAIEKLAIAGEQARVIGSLQHPLVAGDHAGVARLLRELAPMYAQLQASLPGG